MKKYYFNLFIAFFLINVLFTTYAYGENLKLKNGGRVSVELITSDAAFSNTLSLVSPNNVAKWASGCNLESAAGLPGLPLLSEKAAQHGCRVELDADASTPGIQGFAAGTILEFNMLAKTGSGDYIWSSDSSKNVGEDGFDHVKITPLSSTADVYRLNWEDLPKASSDKDFNDLIAVVRVDVDTDGDGLWDDWETDGIDTNGDGAIDLNLAIDDNNDGDTTDPGEHASPSRKDIFLQIDYMDCAVTGGDCASESFHSHKPKPAAVQKVKDAFNAKGITLHVDVKNPLPHKNILGFSTTGKSEFDDIKEKYFGANNPRRFAYHYGLFIHNQTDKSTSSGKAETGGNDFIVSLGEWNTVCILPSTDRKLDTQPTGDDLIIHNEVEDNFLNYPGDIITAGPNLKCDTTALSTDWQEVAPGQTPNPDPDGDTLEDRNIGTVMQQAGTLMHELGHNLNLKDGGNDDLIRKPNYLSTMNYFFQTKGIPYGSSPSSLSYRLDYSKGNLAPLDENNLDETKAIGTGMDYTRYYCPVNPPPAIIDVKRVPVKDPIDWNCKNPGERNVQTDINNDGAPPLTSTPLYDFDDWGHLKYDFQNSNNFEDGVRFEPDMPELDFPTELRMSGEIHGVKWEDYNGNGIKDPGEPRLAGWTITLKDSSGNILETNTTDINGNYAFVDLPVGNYTIEEVLKTGWKQTAPAGGIYTVAISYGENVKDKDFGNKKFSIFGMKFNDKNSNKRRDVGEEGMAGWHIRLIGVDTSTGASVNREEITDINGNYGFINVNPGIYQIFEVMQGPNWVPTTSVTVPINLKANENINVNFGNKKIP